MDFSNKQIIVCYIDSNKILFYIGMTGAMLQLDLPPEVLSYLDLLHKEKFEQLTEAFLQQNKLIGGNVILIYSQNTSFEKDFEETADGKVNSEIQKFVDIVPFEDVLSKEYKLNKKVKAVAINNRVNESIKFVFERNKFLIYAAIPISILQETFPELKTNIDLGFIASKTDSIKQYSMIDGSITNSPVLEKKPEPEKQNKRIYALGGVFGALLVVLIIVIVINLSPQPAPKESSNMAAPPITPRPVIQETSENENPTTIIETSSSPSATIN